jgi:hypothetical protein
LEVGRKGEELTSAVPARATNAERKLKNKALDTVNPDRTRIPKSPTLTKKKGKKVNHQQIELKV